MGRAAFAGVCVYYLVMSVLGTGLGRCPLYPPLPNFDIQKMTGTWYEVERSFYFVEITASCTEIDVALNDKGYFVITIKTINRLTGSPLTTYGLGIPSHNGSSIFRYKLNNRMPYVIGRLLPGAGQYNILFTDYTQYALLWSCNSFSIAHADIKKVHNGNVSADRIWVVGREREMGAGVRAQVYGVMQQLRLDPDRLILSKNNNCTGDTIH